MKEAEIQRQEYENILKCKDNYLNTAFCRKIKGDKDKSCGIYQRTLDSCQKKSENTWYHYYLHYIIISTRISIIFPISL